MQHLVITLVQLELFYTRLAYSAQMKLFQTRIIALKILNIPYEVQVNNIIVMSSIIHSCTAKKEPLFAC